MDYQKTTLAESLEKMQQGLLLFKKCCTIACLLHNWGDKMIRIVCCCTKISFLLYCSIHIYNGLQHIFSFLFQNLRLIISLVSKATTFSYFLRGFAIYFETQKILLLYLFFQLFTKLLFLCPYMRLFLYIFIFKLLIYISVVVIQVKQQVGGA